MDAGIYGVFYMDKLEGINSKINDCKFLLLMCKRNIGQIRGWRKNIRDCDFHVQQLEQALNYLENLIKEYNQ